jgi:hypothetical protein
MTLDVKKSNSSNETPNVMTVGVEKYGLRALGCHYVVVFCILHQILCNRLMRVTSIFVAVMCKVAVT